MYKSDFEIKKELCEIGRRIYNDGFVAANDGNFSVKIDDNTYYVTPTGVSKGFMTPEMICKVDGQGNLKRLTALETFIRIQNALEGLSAKTGRKCRCSCSSSDCNFICYRQVFRLTS